MSRRDDISQRVRETYKEFARDYNQHDRNYPGMLMPSPYHQTIRDAFALLPIVEAAVELCRGSMVPERWIENKITLEKAVDALEGD